MKKLILLMSFVLLVGFVFAMPIEASKGGMALDDKSPTLKPEARANGSLNGSAVKTNLKTQNKGEETQLQNRMKISVKNGEFESSNGKKIKIETRANNQKEIKVGNVKAQTRLEVMAEKTGEGNKTRLRVKLSNGKEAEVKVMPDSASEKALERLRLKVCSEENGCSIELKETGKGDEVKATYEIQLQRHSRLFGIFSKKMNVKAEVDAESGEVKIKKPWWAFLAVEPAEV